MSEALSPIESFDVLKRNVVDSVTSHFPLEGKKNTLVATNVRVDDHLAHDDIQSQASARDHETTWGVPVKADIKLVDKATGKVLDEKKGMTLARLPKLTNRYGYIIGGSEYQVDHLFKLKSGVYTRVKQNGELESEFNLKKSPTGRGFSLHFSPKNKKFSFKYGDAHIPLYPVMKSMGVSDDQLEQDWGKEIFAANKSNDDKSAKDLASFFKRTSDSDTVPENVGELAKHVNTFFGQTQLLPDTTHVTMGKPFTTVNGEALRIGANKVLGVSKGTMKVDDRDSLIFKEVASIEDFIPEKISRNSREIKRKMKQNVDHKATVGEIVSPDLFNKPIQSFFTGGKAGLAERSDQTNPIQMLSAHRKTTLMSEELGGIKSAQMITTGMRGVNASHLGFLDPAHTPESEKTGVTLYLAANTKKNGKDLEIPVFDLKSGKTVHSTAADFHMKAAVLPDQVKWENGRPVPISPNVKVKTAGGDVEIRPFKEADYVMTSAKGMFDHASNLIPFLPCDQGNRVSMATKQMEQAISLKHREVPLVQAKTDAKDPTHTFDKLVGRFVATKTPVDGKVVAVGHDSITVHDGSKKHEVQIYNHFPLNDPKGMMHSEPVVKVGDTVKAGQVVADNNYTKGGTLATGTNLRVGYMPYKGYNFEDGIVISESAAKKLVSEHLYKHDIEIDPTDKVSKAALQSHAVVSSSKMTKEQWENIGDDGVVRVGAKVLPGQVLVAAIGKNNVQKGSTLIGKLGSRAIKPWRDKSLTWDSDHAGVVTKVVRSPDGKGVKVYVKTEEEAIIGDKLSGRHGNKGIITKILPDHEMPHTVNEKGEKEPLQILLNPSGVPTRINMGQMFEAAAGKIAKKTGQPYVVNNFAGPNHDYRQQVLDDLKKHGLSDEEMVYDPHDQRAPLGSVMVGNSYILKLKHQVDKKINVRGGGTTVEGRSLGYDADHQPDHGGHSGGQGFGQYDMYALLSHNARATIREMTTYKSDQQDAAFWSMIQAGHEPPPPKPSFAYEKFTTMLRGLGVNVEKKGTTVQVLPMTNKQILDQAGGGKHEITKGNLTLRAKDLKEEPGGLFDFQATGGKDGSKWSYMRLAEPMPNPIFVGQNNKPGPIPVLLGLKMKEFDEVMDGKTQLHGMTGGKAIEAALKKINVDQEIATTRKDLTSKTGAQLDWANKKMKVLLALKENNLQPHDAYVLHNIPIIPPKFRPANPTNKGDISFAPLNGLYRQIAQLNTQMQKFDGTKLTDDHKNPIRSQLWDAMKAMQSVGRYNPVFDPDSSGNRELAGILDTIAVGGVEGQPKEGYFQSKLMKRRQNLSIRSTIIPEPALGLDEVGLPKHAAMEMYKPYVVQQLHRWGMDPLSGQDEIKRDTALAHKALEKAMEERPLLLKRDPVLHKASIQAFKPRIVEGKAIKIHPLTCEGFNADFDGDTMAGTLPMSREAVEEAKKMMPSKNLFNPSSGEVVYYPTQDAMLGLHLMSKWGKDTGKTFNSVAELEKAVDTKQVSHNDVVRIKGMFGGKLTTFGRVMMESRMPRNFSAANDILHNPQFEINKKTLPDQVVKVLAKNHPEEFAKSIDALKDMGNEHSYRIGFSFGLKDLAPIKGRDEIINAAHKEVEQLKKTVKNPDELRDKTVDVYLAAGEKLDKAAKEQLEHSGNRLAQMVYSGARGKLIQFRQMVAAPMLMTDSEKKIVPVPVTKSYSEGLDVGDYWLAQHGSRRGTMERRLGTSEPGVITKDIVNSMLSTTIVSQDCGTRQGVLMDIGHEDLHDRYTAAPYQLRDKTAIKEGTLITPEVSAQLRNNKIDKVLVRSALKCEHGEGICAKCFGLNESGKLHPNGTNIGTLASQSLGAPVTQMTMDAFHTGGVATTRAETVDRVGRLQDLLNPPKKLLNQATLANATGKIHDIKPDASGGVDVFIGGTKHYVPKDRVDPKIQVGMEIKKGDKLSKGFVNPHDLLAATGDIHAVQNFMNNEMYDVVYKKSGVRKRNVEVAVRALTNLTKVTDPGDSDHLHGDIVPRTVVEEHNRSLPKGAKPVVHEPILKASEQIPSLITRDWMARLNYRNLHQTIQQAAAEGMKSNIHGANPVPGIAFGAEFGKAPAGSPSHHY